MAQSEYDSWSVTFVHKTAKAVLLDFGDWEKWVPLSCLSDDSQVEVLDAEKDDNLDVEIAEWWSDANLRCDEIK